MVHFKIFGRLISITIRKTGLPSPRSRTGRAMKATIDGSGLFTMTDLLPNKLALIKAVRKYAREQLGLDPTLVEAKEWVEAVYLRGVVRK